MANLQPQPQPGAVGPETLITVKVLVADTNRRFKVALRDLGAHVLPQKLRDLLAIPSESELVLERYSDSAARYIVLDSTNPAIYKQLYRAAKAKLKLRLRATVLTAPKAEKPIEKAAKETPRPNTYLETVLSQLPTVRESQSTIHPPDAVPCAYAMPGAYAGCARPNLSHATLPTISDFSFGTFTIDCNNCGQTVPSEHYHCSICAGGDFDLCKACVDRGLSCPGDGHWLIKRTIKNGRVYPSFTEKLQPKSVAKAAPTLKSTTFQEEEERTCNSCISQLPASSFVTCRDCPDFDLCYPCFEGSEHGHHPAHGFSPVSEQTSLMSSALGAKLAAGRGLKHDAYCDGCDKHVIGVRHKCLTCPDFDYCTACAKDAKVTHPGHRFAPLYEQLKHDTSSSAPEDHRGIYCDGARCSGRPQKMWIRGDRYKCAVCHDFDLCASCEANPVEGHNRTHPLIKIKTPIRFVSIATINEDQVSNTTTRLGDQPIAQTASSETTQPAKPATINAATQVQTLAEVKPAETIRAAEVNATTASPADLQAWFESDSTPDGTSVEPDHHMSQAWTLRNPGPTAWPAGCAVYYIGGDDMRNLDMKHPSSVSSLTAANQSDVLSEALEPGKTAVFTVLLKSPLRTGRAISYWRLKTPDGHPFGHKLWVDINVAHKSTHAAAGKAVPAPLTEASTEGTVGKSVMIFPKLDKESPESSLLEISQPLSVTAETDTVVEDDLAEDLESLDLAEDDDTEDGFLTDEEYDILDADDEEFLVDAQRAAAGQH